MSVELRRNLHANASARALDDLRTSKRFRILPLQATLALLLLAAVAATVGAFLFLYNARRSVIDRAAGDLTNYAFVLVEQTDRAIQAVEFVHKDIVERIRHDIRVSAKPFDEVASSPALFETLRERAGDLPFVSGLAIVRKDGVALATSQERALFKSINIAEREYFQRTLSSTSEASHISGVIPSRITGRNIVVISRKITSSDGDVLGIINAALDIGYFTRLYERFVASGRLETKLLRQSGDALAQYPPADRSGKAWPLDNEIKPLLNGHDSGSVSYVSDDRGEARLAAVKASVDFPIAVVVSDAYASILGNWRTQAGGIAIAAILMNLAIGFAWYLSRRHLKSSIRRAATESYLARYDVLTKTPNRLYFLEEMQRSIDAAWETKQDFVLLLIDLNRFKEINDTLGHPVGDRMIKSVATRLHDILQPGDFSARIGGDEFAIILRNPGCVDDVASFADGLLACLGAPHLIDEKMLHCRCSIGIAIGPLHGAGTDDLLKAADLALYAAKANPTVGYRFFDIELNRNWLRRRDLELALPKALENDEFVLRYQPIMSLENGRCWGFESLVRWCRPGHGLVPPNDFIPALESIGLIIPVGRKILAEACAAAALWPSPMRVSVNVSPIQLASDEIIGHVREALDQAKLRPGRLTIEVTESVQLGDRAHERLRAIREMGVSIALDDFGTGFASMSYLQRYPYDKIKIDRSFVANMSDPKSRAIVEATINMARALRMETTAEGVETLEQLNELRQAGATQAQGYLFARPMPECEIASFLQEASPAKAA